ncbi:MAG: 3-phosphoshikimate 1-carboxyvinyltransferase [Saprospiraceae bacterium]|nr:3-phosphoshikimate 1-carboxyvinyltransferase [Saprospiraceae bacterium]
MTFLISKENKQLTGDILLDGSKSISNRALLIRALTSEHFDISHLSTSEDSQTMVRLLNSADQELDAGPAGTTFRFLTAYLAIKEGEQILTGSARMKQRPIGPLVDALNILGANIQYLEKKGYPPLRIGDPQNLGKSSTLQIPADISSQFISALLMIAPVLPNGLEIKLVGDLVSASYLQMTLTMMHHFGITYSYQDQVIRVPTQSYQAKPYTVEADWSAASYHYAAASLAVDADLRLHGLQPQSMQGDSITSALFKKLGLITTWHNEGLQITRHGKPDGMLEHDYLLCPDIAQTIAVAAAGLGISSLFSGLETLSIKETDRIAALQTELMKVGTSFHKMPARFSKETQKTYYMLEGKASWDQPPRFATYHDHRMAMAFAPLSILAPVVIEDPGVVGKSYPGFWDDLTTLGWSIELIDD